MKVYRQFLISTLLIVFLLGSVTGVSAATRTFPAGSYIIPVEPCWQPNNDPNVITLPGYCDTDKNDQGVFQSYGMIYDLLTLGVPVYWIIAPNKASLDDVDMSVLKSGANPAVTIYHSTALSSTGTLTQVYYSGGPFVIDINDLTSDIRTQAEQIMGIAASGNIFTSPKIHKTNYDFTAEVDKTLTGTPPKVAVLGEGATQVLLDYLKASGLGNRVYAIFTTVTSTDIVNDALDDYQLLWAPHWIVEKEVDCASIGNPSWCTTDDDARNKVLEKMRAFIETGNAGFFECASIESLEGSIEWAGTKTKTSGLVSQTYGGILTSKDYTVARFDGDGGSMNSDDVVVEETSYFLNQCSGWRFDPSGGHIHNFRPRVDVDPDYVYNSTVTRFIHDRDDYSYSSPTPAGPPGYDYFVGGRINGSLTQGYVSYLAGHRYVECEEKGDPVPSERHIELTFDQDISTASSPAVEIEIIHAGCTEGNNCPKVSYNISSPVEDIASDGTVYVQTENITYDSSTYKLSPIIIGNITSSSVTITKINVTFPTTPAAVLTTITDITDLALPSTVCTPNTGSVAACGPITMSLGLLVTNCSVDWNKSNTCGIRYVLNTLLGLQFQIIPNEYSKAQIVVKDNIVYKATFEYPGYKGHLYAIDAVSNPAATLWDAGSGSVMPSAGVSNPASPTKTNSTRYIFTNEPGTTTKINFQTSNLSTLKPLLYVPDYATISDTTASILINTVRGRKNATETDPDGNGDISKRLGGIEHSTPAIIARSANIRDADNNVINRDKIIFTGNHDGMLHAFYAGSWSGGSYDSGTGKEIWAYMPSSLLSSLRNQTFTNCNAEEDPNDACYPFPVAVSVDSSPAVGDFYVDIDGDGNKEFRTILVATAVVKIPGNDVQSVNQGIVFALDVTDPYSPTILWERTYTGTISSPTITRNYYPSSSFPSSYVNDDATDFIINMGNSKGGSIGRVQIGSTLNTYVFLTSKWVSPVDTGTAGSPHNVWGLSAFALDFDTGDIIWSTKLLHTGDAEGVNEAPAISALMDIDNNGTDDYAIFGDMQGRLWALRTNDGKNISGDTPAFVVEDSAGNPTGALEPIGASAGIHREAVVFGTGGRDSLPGESTYIYRIFSVGIRSTGGYSLWSTPIELNAGEKVWSPPLIDSQGRIYIATATGYSDVGRPDLVRSLSTGRFLRINLTTGSIEMDLTVSGAVVGGVDIENRHAYVLTFGGDIIQIGEEDFTSSTVTRNPFRMLWWRKL